MNPVLKLTVFALALLVVFAGGLAAGRASGPFAGSAAPTHTEHSP